MQRRYDLSELSVMVVDDSHAMLTIMRIVLQSMGVRHIRTLPNPAEALGEFDVVQPDVIFIDWMMAPLDGREFIRIVRGLPGPIKFVPMIVLTGHADRRLVGRARDIGADYTLCKPVSLENVLKAFVHLRNGRRSFVQVGPYFGPDRRRKARPFEFTDRRGGKARADARTGDDWELV